MGTSCLNFHIRTQFTLTVSERDLSRILNGLAGEGVAINGYSQTLTGKAFHFVRVVVGTSVKESEHDILTIRKVMHDAAVPYKENLVIQLLDALPENTTFLDLLWSKMQVRTIYLGVNQHLYIDVSNIHYAIQLLSEEV